MTNTEVDQGFIGSLPKVYQTYLVPLIFEPYASDLANRLAARPVGRVLEIAAGTGAVTRALASVLPESVSIVASDLNQPMLDQAMALGTARPVEWRQADAMKLPFDDEAFDAVICQFGVMFFPDKAKAFAEARRVLRSGGALMFNVWDRIDENDFAETVTAALAAQFPADPPRFLARIPHGYHDPSTIERDLAGGGFTALPEITTVAKRSQASSPGIPAIAYCQGTPLRNEIDARSGGRIRDVTARAAEAVARRFGSGAVDGRMQALVVAVEK